MEEPIVVKLKSLVAWYAKNNSEETRKLVTDVDKDKIAQLQQLIDQPLPLEFIQLYSAVNGEEGPGMGIFLAHSLLSVDEIIHAVKLSKTFVKPSPRTIDHPSESERLVKEIIDEFKKSMPKDVPWYKLEFMCAPDTLGFPYYYPDQNTTDRQKQMFGLDDVAQQNVYNLAKQLHELEKAGYNWDELHVTAFSDGDYSALRKDFAFIADIPFTSFPEGAIKKKYFNPAWIPILFDNMGNYIGLDLDPDINGTAGQVINFGRDEEDMFVIADSFEKFLDFNLTLIENDKDLFLHGKHIHDIYKGILTG